MILRITRCLGVLYHAWSSHQSLRTSTVCITALSKEKARKFYVFPFHWLYYIFQCWVVAVIELYLIMMNLNYKMLHKGVVFVKFANFVCFCSDVESQKRFQHLTNAFGGTKWSRDISRDLLTQYLYFIMLRTILLCTKFWFSAIIYAEVIVHR